MNRRYICQYFLNNMIYCDLQIRMLIDFFNKLSLFSIILKLLSCIKNSKIYFFLRRIKKMCDIIKLFN